jgi:hypothetical protein
MNDNANVITVNHRNGEADTVATKARGRDRTTVMAAWPRACTLFFTKPPGAASAA